MNRHSPDTREHILATGEVLVHGRSFNALGLTELLCVAKIPKGSFYHYFKSKEEFGVALLERYFANYHQQLALLLQDPQHGSGQQRLQAYFQGWLDHACADASASCLVVKLAAEVSDLSEAMRLALKAGMAAIVEAIAACIRAGQLDGSIPSQLDADDAASALYSLWLGAALMVKTQHDPIPLRAAMRHTTTLLQVHATD